MAAICDMQAINKLQNKLYLILALVAALVTAFIYLWNWSAALSSPYSLNFEGPMLWAADALSQGQNIYSADGLQKEPWVTTIYPPLYLAFLALLAKLLGVNYFAMRVASMLFTAGLAAVLVDIFHRLKLSLPAILSSLVFLFSFDCMSTRGFEVRPDIAVVFFCALLLQQFVVVCLDEKKQEALKSYLSVFLLGAVCIEIKQQAIVFMLAIVVYLFAEGHRKIAGVLLGGWLLSILIFSGIMQLFTGAYIHNLVFLSPVKSSSNILIGNLGSIGIDWIKLIVALFLVPAGILALRKLEGLQKFPLLLALISTALFFYSMGIPASSSNHMMAALLALSWFLALCLDKLPALCGIILLVASACSFPFLSEEGRYRGQLLPFARKDADVLQHLGLEGKPVLTDDLYINYLTHSKPVLVDCATFLNVWKAKGELGNLTTPISEKRYAAVIINSNDNEGKNTNAWWPPPVIEAIHANYHKTAELHCSGWSLDLLLPNK